MPTGWQILPFVYREDVVERLPARPVSRLGDAPSFPKPVAAKLNSYLAE
jgi:hypothetical protein